MSAPNDWRNRTPEPPLTLAEKIVNVALYIMVAAAIGLFIYLVAA